MPDHSKCITWIGTVGLCDRAARYAFGPAQQRVAEPHREYPDDTKVGMLGLGTIGAALAWAQLAARFDTRVGNRPARKAGSLAADDAIATETGDNIAAAAAWDLGYLTMSLALFAGAAHAARLCRRGSASLEMFTNMSTHRPRASDRLEIIAETPNGQPA